MRLADLTLHDCPLNSVTLDFAGATLRLRISQYHDARQAYEDYELTFRGVTDFSWTELHDFPYGYELEITNYSEQAESSRLRLQFGLLTGSGGPFQELAFCCAGYEVRPAATESPSVEPEALPAPPEAPPTPPEVVPVAPEVPAAPAEAPAVAPEGLSAPTEGPSGR